MKWPCWERKSIFTPFTALPGSPEDEASQTSRSPATYLHLILNLTYSFTQY